MASFRDMIIRYDQFKPATDNVEFGKVNQNKSGQGKSVRLSYNRKQLTLQTQKLRNPFGFSRGMEGTPQYGKKFSCTLSFDLGTEKGKDFMESLRSLEELVAREAYEHRVEWGLGKNAKMSKDMTEKEVRNMMTPIVKVPVDKETGEEISDYAPTFRVTFNTRNHEETGEVLAITSEVYDQEGNKVTTVDESTIRAGSYCKVLMYANSVWVSPTGYGVNFRIKQIKVYPGDGLPTGKCLIDDEDDEEEDREETGDEEDVEEVTSGAKKLSLRSRD
tara:strand:+ start:7368 stop:8192 length:825 start_codon:yes stop_codon:yes gene_type:complete